MRTSKKCNWLRHLGTKKDSDGVENGEGGGDMGGEGALTIMPYCWKDHRKDMKPPAPWHCR